MIYPHLSLRKPLKAIRNGTGHSPPKDGDSGWAPEKGEWREAKALVYLFRENRESTHATTITKALIIKTRAPGPRGPGLGPRFPFSPLLAA